MAMFDEVMDAKKGGVKVAADDSSTASCSEELRILVIIFDDIFMIILITTGNSPRKIVSLIKEGKIKITDREPNHTLRKHHLYNL